MANRISAEWHQPGVIPYEDEILKTRFAGVLANIDISLVGRYASKVRQSGHPSTIKPGIDPAVTSSALIPCKVSETPLNGAFNIVFELIFHDGVRWMLKVPANGHRDEFCALSQSALISEARTMQMVGSKTTISVPTVYAFNPTVENELGVPFIMMEKIDGMCLWPAWFDGTEAFRTRVLQELAAAMIQLNQFRYDRSGSLLFDDDGNVEGISPTKVEDGIHYMDGTLERTQWSGRGPMTDAKSFYLYTLDRLADGIPVCQTDWPEYDCFNRGLYKSLRMFIDWACEANAQEKQDFVLSHPDLDLQNILVGEDGSLRGIIDWDGAASVPRDVGCLSYPTWLTVDWAKEFFESREYAGIDPEECEYYRAMYAQLMAAEIQNLDEKTLDCTALEALKGGGAGTTGRSVLMKKLDVAANYANISPHIVEYIHRQIEALTEVDWAGIRMESLRSCGEANVQEKPTETQNHNKGAGTIDSHEPVIDTVTKDNDLVIFDASAGIDAEIDAEIDHDLALLSQVAHASNKPTTQNCPTIAATATNDEPFSKPAEIIPLSRKVKVAKSCCRVGQRVLKRTAKVFYTKTEDIPVSESKPTVQPTSSGSKQAIFARIRKIVIKLVNIIRNKLSFGAESTCGICPLLQGAPKAQTGADVCNAEKAVNNEIAEDVEPTVPVIHDESKQQVTKESKGPGTGTFLVNEIADISMRRNVLLEEKRQKQGTREEVAEAPAQGMKQRVWSQIASDVGELGVPLEFVQKTQDRIIVDILQMFEQDQKERKESLTAPSVPHAGETSDNVDEIEKGMLNNVDESTQLPIDESIAAIDASQIHSNIVSGYQVISPELDEREAAKTTYFDLKVAERELKSILGIQKNLPETETKNDMPEGGHNTDVDIQKLKALLRVASSDSSDEADGYNRLEASILGLVAGELVKDDVASSRTPSPADAQENSSEGLTGYTTPDNKTSITQEPRYWENQAVSSEKEDWKAMDFNDFVRGKLDASNPDIQHAVSRIKINEADDVGRKETTAGATAQPISPVVAGNAECFSASDAEGSWNTWWDANQAEYQNLPQSYEEPGRRNDEKFTIEDPAAAIHNFKVPESKSDPPSVFDESERGGVPVGQAPTNTHIARDTKDVTDGDETSKDDRDYQDVADGQSTQIHQRYDAEDHHQEDEILDDYLNEWVDDGDFTIMNICMLLDRGELDEMRMLRLKQGFLMLMQKLAGDAGCDGKVAI